MAASNRETENVLNQVERTIHNASRCFSSDDVDCQRVLIDLRQAQRSVGIIQMDNINRNAIESTITRLIEQLELKVQRMRTDQQGNEFSAPRRKSNGGRGRPSVVIASEQLKMLYNMKYTAPQMAKHFGCSEKLIYKRLYEQGLKLRDRYSTLTDGALDESVNEIQKKFHNAGSVMTSGFLQTGSIYVQRKRVRESISRVSPIPVVQRLAKTTKRRQYSVLMSNSLWHMDGHMKLNRWGISTHGCIDGYSRLITFLHSDTDNSSSTVLKHFVGACQEYSIPSRIRTDHGGENVMVALFMNLINGESRNSNITGRSVHNQRIERLWKDVFCQVIGKYYSMFYEMEDKGLLDVENRLHILALQTVYVPIINDDLKAFQLAWNNHKISTENNLTPHQLWVNGVLKNVNSNAKPITNMYDSDMTGQLNSQLRSYGLNPDDFQEEQVVDGGGEGILSGEQKVAMLALLTNDLSNEQKYEKCLEYFTEIDLIS